MFAEIFLIVLLCFVLFILLVSLYLFLSIFKVDRLDIEKEKNKRMDIVGEYAPLLTEGHRWFDKAKKQKLEMYSFDNLKLKGYFIEKESSKDIVLLFHGYGSGPVCDFAPYFSFFYDTLGMSVFAPYQRAQGESEGKYVTLGIDESRDTADWINYMATLFPDKNLYAYGISMGSSALLMASAFGMPKNLKCIFADSGFTSPYEIIKHVAIEDYHIPEIPFIYGINFWCKVLGNFSIFENSTLNALKLNHTPILYIHGKADSFVPLTMSKRNYRATKSKKKFITVRNAIHGASFIIANNFCKNKIVEFIEENKSA